MMTSFEIAIFNFIMHFIYLIAMFALFCGGVLILALVVTTVWYFIEEGVKYLKEWRAKKNESKD